MYVRKNSGAEELVADGLASGGKWHAVMCCYYGKQTLKLSEISHSIVNRGGQGISGTDSSIAAMLGHRIAQASSYAAEFRRHAVSEAKHTSEQNVSRGAVASAE